MKRKAIKKNRCLFFCLTVYLYPSVVIIFNSECIHLSIKQFPVWWRGNNTKHKKERKGKFFRKIGMCEVIRLIPVHGMAIGNFNQKIIKIDFFMTLKVGFENAKRKSSRRHCNFTKICSFFYRKEKEDIINRPDGFQFLFPCFSSSFFLPC